LEGFVSSHNISFLLVFTEGLLSFFSPCVIPLLPIYMSYLSGSSEGSGENGVLTFKKRKVLYHTLFFILGISFAFFALGTSFTVLGKFISSNRYLFIRISGILIIILGLFQLGVFQLSFLQRERKIPFKIINRKVNPLIAFLLGFTFSFAWTPCIGPALSSVLMLASGAKTTLIGNLLILVYAIGFVFPFLLLGLFTAQVLDFLKKKQRLLKYTIKAGGILLIIIGFMTFSGFMNGISSYLNSSDIGSGSENDSSNDSSSENVIADDSTTTDADSSIDFTLTDQLGNEHTLSDYLGKVVLINFYATWCGPCNQELPDIEKLYEEYGSNQADVIFLGITNPKTKDYPFNSDEKADAIKAFIKEKDLSYPTLFDETGEVFKNYGVSAFPTSFFIDKKGNVLGYIQGAMTEAIMDSAIKQALNATE
jgi:cytochrome c-type biogenesis protein